MRVATVLLLLLISTQAWAQDLSKPQMTPFFDRIDDGPAFFVICRNTGNAAIWYGASVWPVLGTGNLRVDGSVVEDKNFGGGGQRGMNVEPAQQWRGIISLRRSEGKIFLSPKFGAERRDPSQAIRPRAAHNRGSMWTGLVR